MAGKVIMVTGANSGIGYHLCAALLERGHRVVGLDISSDRASALQSEYLESYRFFPCDVTNREQVDASVQHVIDSWGGIDILVNNACLAVFRPFLERSDGETRKEFEVNFFGTINMIRAVLPALQARGGGVIHNVSSGVGLTGFPGLAGYSSTKGALEALTRTLALEFAPLGITVNLIHPPLTDTPSAAPLGVPVEFMADPAEVGRKLARIIGSRKDLITPDFPTRMGLFANRLIPLWMGRMLARMTARAREEQQGMGSDE